MTIALWCVFVAGLLPYAAVGIAKIGGKGYDNASPREWLARTDGFRARANAAQLNSFEAFPFFAAAVLIAHFLYAPQNRVDMLAMIFLAARVGYIGLYVANRPTLRSLFWFVGAVCVVSLFFVAA